MPVQFSHSFVLGVVELSGGTLKNKKGKKMSYNKNPNTFLTRGGVRFTVSFLKTKNRWGLFMTINKGEKNQHHSWHLSEVKARNAMLRFARQTEAIEAKYGVK